MSLNSAWWAADDLYADDTSLGAAPTELPPRLALVMAAMDPVAPAGEFSDQLDQALRSDRVLVALKYGTDRMLMNSAADWGPSDPLAIPKTVDLMWSEGFSEAEIQKVVWDNPHRFFGQSPKWKLEK